MGLYYISANYNCSINITPNRLISNPKISGIFSGSVQVCYILESLSTLPTTGMAFDICNHLIEKRTVINESGRKMKTHPLLTVITFRPTQ